MATALAAPPARPTAPATPTRPPLPPAALRPPAGPLQPPRPSSRPVPPLPWPAASRPSRPGGRPPRHSSDAELAAQRFATVCLEVLNGFRPMAHLRRLIEPRGFEMAACGIRRRAAGARTAQTNMVRIRRIRVCEPVQGVAEASVVFSRDGLAWSMAIRLERRQQRWLCTVAQTLG